MSDVDKELVAVFRDEVADAFNSLVGTLEALGEAEPNELDSHLRSAFRIVHNIKGAAHAAGLDTVLDLAHAMEDGLGACQRAHVAPTVALDQALRRAMLLILARAEGKASDEAVMALAGELAAVDDAKRTVATASGAEGDGGGAEGDGGVAEREPGNVGATVRMSVSRLDRLMGFSGDMLAALGEAEQRHAALVAFDGKVRAARAATNGEAPKLLAEMAVDIDALVQRDRRQFHGFRRMVDEFCGVIKTARMQPLLDLAPQWRRIVGELCIELHKKARLVIDVAQIEIDRRILDGLRDPLTHLLRNAVDHGIELPAERLSRGKPEIGTITLRARSVGASVELQIQDDGVGMDLRRIGERAVTQGLLDAPRRQALTEAEAAELVFSPGFSTALGISRVSGRGVGLDIVRDRVSALGGSALLLRAPQGQGAVFQLLVPASLVSTKGLVVRTASATYAIPIAYVERGLRVGLDRVRSAHGVALIEQPDTAPLELRWLSALLAERGEPDLGQLSIVVISHEGRRLGLVVREVVGEAEFVSGRLPWNVRHAPGVAEATMLGDGTLALVVDVAELFLLARDHKGGVDPATTRKKHRVLVIDDSLTSRTLERNILVAGGYEVETANDGEAGWSALQSGTVELVITDVDMPVLGGIELTRRLRAHPRFKSLPIVLVTSLGRPEDLAAGSEAGADEYIVKGHFDQQQLLDAVGRLLA